MAWSRQPAAPGCHSGCGPRCIVWRPTASAGHPPAASISHDTWQVAGCRLHGAEEWQLVQHWWRHKSGSQAMGAAGAMNQWISTSAWIGLQPHNTRDGTRAHNLLLRGEAPYPLGHTSMCLVQSDIVVSSLCPCRLSWQLAGRQHHREASVP